MDGKSLTLMFDGLIFLNEKSELLFTVYFTNQNMLEQKII